MTSYTTITLTSTNLGIDVGSWEINSLELNLPLNAPYFKVRQRVLHGGIQEGTKVIYIECRNGMEIVLCPSRGMNLLYALWRDIYIGWHSPVREFPNPSFIECENRGGCGWLLGFNEAIVRCGYEWAGHPMRDGDRQYSLHGRCGNIPCSVVEVCINKVSPYDIKVRGLVREVAFKQVNFETWTELRHIPGTKTYSLHDCLKNHGCYPHPYQVIYHCNYSKPLLEKGSEFVAPVSKVGPFNKYACDRIDSWQTFTGPTANYDETVYNVIPIGDKQNETMAILHNNGHDLGIAVRFNVSQLPHINLWKNTDKEKQGYVMGIEPSTNCAYNILVEKEQGRLKEIGPGEEKKFDLTFTVLDSKTDVAAHLKEVEDIQGDIKTELSELFMSEHPSL